MTLFCVLRGLWQEIMWQMSLSESWRTFFHKMLNKEMKTELVFSFVFARDKIKPHTFWEDHNKLIGLIGSDCLPRLHPESHP